MTDAFWKLLDERLELCFEALMCRHNALMGVKQRRLPRPLAARRHRPSEEAARPSTSCLVGGYSTISLGYIGLYEVTKLVKGCSHTEPEGEDFALRLMTPPAGDH